MAPLSDAQMRRYSRQILLREVGGRGQLRLLAARPALLCAGELGQLAAEYLWRAGMTELRLYAPTPEQAVALDRALATAGYAGAPCQPLRDAPLELKELAGAAPEFTVLWPQDSDGLPDPLWACCRGSTGVVGEGASALRATATRLAAVGSQPESGAGAMVVGSALALLALQRLLQTGPATERAALWQVDLDSETLPAWESAAV